ncbi:DUF6624 domain-containing protein [Fulvivirga lutimaris]|uniref:DUF6624 domain-containing protein n=1 Tax=Fulvivirga lutimaris TaxID=1819566 RepID=UPI0012BB7829|nr:DUF6624 domain-containing protein [Fulvivirga lutimaris]MTI40254.1 hypothetical protein [Fulvivirga lutimaris]
MNRLLLLFLLCFLSCSSSTEKNQFDGEDSIQTYAVDCDQVRIYLEEALRTDQGVRNGEIAISMEEVDEANQALFYSIMQCCGADKIIFAGEQATQAAFLITQHAPLEFQLAFVNLFKDWSKEGIISPSTFVLMVDRIRLRQGKTQLYGTQVVTDKSGVSKLSPVDDLEKVRARRDSLYMEPLEDYVARFGVTL